MSKVLVINAGSSSMKYQLIDAELGTTLRAGHIERIGEAEVPDFAAAFEMVSLQLADGGAPLSMLGITAVGHRIVMGGADFTTPTLISDDVVNRLRGLTDLAPLHTPGNLHAVEAARTALPHMPHVAVFDTAFHQTMSEREYTYAINREAARKYGVRKFGFHGISHQVVSRRAAEVLGQPTHELKQIVLHLGNGASMCAVDGGRSIATTMGLTPLEGLVMGTRAGSIDPGAMMHMLRNGMSVLELDDMLNKRSGLKGLAGSNDMRDIREAANAGDADARLALEVYVRSIRHYLGSYFVKLGGADALVFTAGVGENSVELRAEVCAGLEWLGVEVDPERNAAPGREPRLISSDASRVAVLVVPTMEEAEIARQTWALVG